ncbi:metacaspase-9-like [Chenopodium quinoa]|uniref:Peptidase C14 caspase domain-containing protein n=1 Tax=Chenopodium quinoa TaxID=63459 RepID=A0A803NAZ9_CHEQI|nr:metacaspase-9-like [Chenopodium quinoa]
MENGKKRMALLVGCNYPNTQYSLHGCINDVVSMQELLMERLGFDKNSIELLVDEGPESKALPSGVNIKNALKKMIDGAEAGDVLFFHYSGHGTLVPSKHHLNKKEEAIVPCDFNLITDVDFRQLVNGIPKGASFIILSDSCHSGGLIDKEKEQIGPNTLSPTSQLSNNLGPKHSKLKNIPIESILNHLASLTNMVESEIGAHLTALFGDDASLRFRLPELDQDKLFGPHRPDSGILLSGCQTNETSADMPPMGSNGKAHGAFTYAVQSVFKAQQGPLSNREVVMLSREVLEQEGLEGQHPCLYCSDENADAPFLMWDDAESNN